MYVFKFRPATLGVVILKYEVSEMLQIVSKSLYDWGHVKRQ